MSTQLANLLKILSDEVELHENLLEVLEEEAKSIGNVPASKLLRIQSAKQLTTHKIASIEAIRVETVQILAKEWGMDFDALTLSKIIARTPWKISNPLQESFERLKQLVGSIRNQAGHNSSLSETRLKPIEMSLKFITDWHKEQQTYSMTGALHNSSKKLSRVSI